MAAQLTDAEIAKRMADLNSRRAATRPAATTTRPAATTAPQARPSAQRVADARARAAASDGIRRAAQTEEDAAVAEIPGVEAKIAELDVAAQGAWAEMGHLVEKYNIAATAADSQGKSTFSGSTFDTTNGPGYFSGTIDNPGQRLAAIRAVEDRFGPELRKAREHLSAIYAERDPLVARQAHLVTAAKVARSKRDRAENNYRAALAILQEDPVPLSAVAAPTTAPATRPAAAPATVQPRP